MRLSVEVDPVSGRAVYRPSDTGDIVPTAFAQLIELELAESKADVIRIAKEQQESFQFQQEARRQFRDGTWHGNTTKDYRDSLSADDTNDFFSLAYQWQDKKHRHVFDLCDWVDQLQDEIKKLKDNDE